MYKGHPKTTITKTKRENNVYYGKCIRNMENNVLELQSCTRKVRGKPFENTHYCVHNLLITLKATTTELLFQLWE